MKRFISIIVALLLFAAPALAGDNQLTSGDPKTKAIRQYYVTGSSAISASLSTFDGDGVYELISMKLHLSAAGGAGDFTATVDSNLGSAYDVVLLTQDMTSVVDLVQLYGEGEIVLEDGDQIDFAWANGSSRTYGLEVLYKLK